MFDNTYISLERYNGFLKCIMGFTYYFVYLSGFERVICPIKSIILKIYLKYI
jgi:hypothetical protein